MQRQRCASSTCSSTFLHLATDISKEVKWWTIDNNMVLVLIRNMLTPRKKLDDFSPRLLNSPMIDVEGGLLATRSDAKSSDKKALHSGHDLSLRLNARIISDATIGLSDGLTVPFALTAGLSALGDNKIVIYAGIAELIAGGISMGLGGYLGAKGEAEAYHAALAEVRFIAATDELRAENMVRATFENFQFAEQTLNSMVSSLLKEPEFMVDFLMRFHHQLAEADYTASRAYTCGLTIALGYFFGGLVPLLPYIVMADIHTAFLGSIFIMALALFAFGWVKTALVGETSRKACIRSGAQMMILGGVAAGAAMGCVKAVGS